MSPPDFEATQRITVLLERGDVFVVTGAGISTRSGIPDYRGPGTRERARNPMQYREFRTSAEARRRYWARSAFGYPRIRDAAPNVAHRALAALAHAKIVTGLVTQNVDGLHVRAEHPDHVELHGALREVICLECGTVGDREWLQAELLSRNGWSVAEGPHLAPDGDADVEGVRLSDVVLVDCVACGGTLKPHVVFFGESVPKTRVERAFEMLSAARSLVVLGSSLAVFSGFRFVRAAHRRGIPIAIVSIGPTRGDELATIKIDADVGDVLGRVGAALEVR
jgi:NAD-dependent deacetylase sirtuin 4